MSGSSRKERVTHLSCSNVPKKFKWQVKKKTCERYVFQQLENMANKKMSLKDENIHKMEKYYGTFLRL